MSTERVYSSLMNEQGMLPESTLNDVLTLCSLSGQMGINTEKQFLSNTDVSSTDGSEQLNVSINAATKMEISDLLPPSPAKLSDILSMLMESPEKPVNFAENGALKLEMNSFVDAATTSVSQFAPLRRSHSCPQFKHGGLQWPDTICQRPSLESSFGILRCQSYDGCCTNQRLGGFVGQIASTSAAAQYFQPIRLDALVDDGNSRTFDEEQDGPCVNIMGYSLPLAVTESDSTPCVCISDVFRTFFSTRHWDEFKLILEKNCIETVSAVSSRRNAFGIPEIVDAIRVSEVESLLLSNQARRDGFVRCLRLSLDGGTSARKSFDCSGYATPIIAESKVIMTSERHVGELSSGIRTRHADQSDILYVELDGCTLPSIVLDGVQYVRLVDVQKKFMPATPLPNRGRAGRPSLNQQLYTLKNICAQLKIDVGKCKPNEKARLVVYAKSFHSNSLHIIAVHHLPRLVEYVRRQQNAEQSRDCTPNDQISSNSIDRTGEIDDWRPNSAETSSVGSDSTNTWTASPSPSPSTDDRLLKRRGGSVHSEHDMRRKRLRKMALLNGDSSMVGSKFADEEAVRLMSVWQNGHLKQPGSSAGTMYRNSSELRTFFDQPYLCDDAGQWSCAVNGARVNELDPFEHFRSMQVQSPWQRMQPMLPLEVSFYVDTSADLDLGLDQDNLYDVLNVCTMDCEIVLERSSSLPVVVYNRDGMRGPAGKFYDHLFVNRGAACIWCYGCKSFLNLPTFINHTHIDGVSLRNPQLFLWVAEKNETNMQGWRSLCGKARSFNVPGFSDYDARDDTTKERVDDSWSQPRLATTIALVDQPEVMQKPPKRQKNCGANRGKSHAILRPNDSTIMGSSRYFSPNDRGHLPLSIRRRPMRGDVFIDILERLSSSAYKSPSSVCIGLSSAEHEKVVDASYAL